MSLDANKAVAILGAGSWGTALGILVARNGYIARLWDVDTARLARMEHEHENATFLPGIKFPSNVSTCKDLVTLIRGTAHVLVAVPSHAYRATTVAIAPLVSRETVIACATKGLEP